MMAAAHICLGYILLITVIPALTLEINAKHFQKCEPNATYIYDINILFRRSTIIEGTIKMGQPFGKTPISFTVQLTTDGNHYFSVVEYKSKNACQKINELGSQLWFDLQRAAKYMQPGSCPVPKGTYAIKNHKLNFNRFGIQAFPKGSFKVITNFTDVLDGKQYGCYVALVELV